LTLDVVDNQVVKKGQVIATLDPRDYDVAVDKASAGLAKAQAMLAMDTARIDSRILVLIGTICNILSLWMLKYLNLDNEGGSIGIAIATTVLSRRAQFHQFRLIEHLTPYDFVYNSRLGKITRGIFPLTGQDPVTNKMVAAKFIYSIMLKQAGVMAYIDVFRMLMFAFVLFLPFIILLSGKKTKEIII